MGQGLLGCMFFSLGLIPTAVHSASNFLKAVSVLIGLVPLIILYQPATVSSFCDDLLDQAHFQHTSNLAPPANLGSNLSFATCASLTLSLVS